MTRRKSETFGVEPTYQLESTAVGRLTPGSRFIYNKGKPEEEVLTVEKLTLTPSRKCYSIETKELDFPLIMALVSRVFLKKENHT